MQIISNYYKIMEHCLLQIYNTKKKYLNYVHVKDMFFLLLFQYLNFGMICDYLCEIFNIDKNYKYYKYKNDASLFMSVDIEDFYFYNFYNTYELAININEYPQDIIIPSGIKNLHLIFSKIITHNYFDILYPYDINSINIYNFMDKKFNIEIDDNSLTEINFINCPNIILTKNIINNNVRKFQFTYLKNHEFKFLNNKIEILIFEETIKIKNNGFFPQRLKVLIFKKGFEGKIINLPIDLECLIVCEGNYLSIFGTKFPDSIKYLILEDQWSYINKFPKNLEILVLGKKYMHKIINISSKLHTIYVNDRYPYIKNLELNGIKVIKCPSELFIENLVNLKMNLEILYN